MKTSQWMAWTVATVMLLTQLPPWTGSRRAPGATMHTLEEIHQELITTKRPV